MTRARVIGAIGERAAAEWYTARGYRIVARNWRCREGEVDLIVGDGRTLVFCEVKARSSAAFGAPVDAVTPVKQARLRRLAAHWLATTEVPPAQRRVLRFDVASVGRDGVEVLEGAF